MFSKKRDGAGKKSGKGRIILVAVILAALGGCLVFAWLSSGALQYRLKFWRDTPVNAVLISIDTLRADHLGCYGYERDTSPRIDALARQGVVFKNAISSTSWTIPAHMAIFTSQYDAVHGVLSHEHCLDHKRVTMAEIFKEAGFLTAGFYTATFMHPTLGFDQGFDQYINCSSVAPLLDSFLERNAPEGLVSLSVPERKELVKKVRHEWSLWKDAKRDVTSPTITEKVIEWLSGHHEERFFLFLHFWDPHYDYIPPPPYDTMFDPDYEGPIKGDVHRNPLLRPDMPKRDLEHLVALYDGEIRWTDMHIGKIMDALQDLGKLDETLVVITSDHGEEFFEHGSESHGKTLYEEVVRVPLIVRLPGTVPEGKVVQSQVRNIDILPTMCELFGLRKSDEAMGKSLAPLMKGDDADPLTSYSLLVRNDIFIMALRTNQWKFIRDRGEERYECYDLEKDPMEKSPLPAEKPMCKRAMKMFLQETKRITTLRNELPRTIPREKIKISPVVAEQLKSLGYIGE